MLAYFTLHYTMSTSSFYLITKECVVIKNKVIPIIQLEDVCDDHLNEAPISVCQKGASASRFDCNEEYSMYDHTNLDEIIQEPAQKKR